MGTYKTEYSVILYGAMPANAASRNLQFDLHAPVNSGFVVSTFEDNSRRHHTQLLATAASPEHEAHFAISIRRDVRISARVRMTLPATNIRAEVLRETAPEIDGVNEFAQMTPLISVIEDVSFGNDAKTGRRAETHYRSHWM